MRPEGMIDGEFSNFELMKKLVAFFFCLQLLSGNAFAMELSKLPSAVQHYFQHEREGHPDLSFLDFLTEHYLDDTHTDEGDGHCHEKLPFKHCHDCCTHNAPVSAFITSDFVQAPGSMQADHVYSSLAYGYIPDGYITGIWQPPKLG